MSTSVTAAARTPRPGSRLGDALAVVRSAVGGLCLLWLPGALVVHRARGAWGSEEWLALGASVAWLVLTVAGAPRPARWSAWIRGPLALALLLAGLDAYGTWLGAWHARRGTAGPAILEQEPGRPHIELNEFGMRGKPGRDRPAGVPVIALVGCSMIYGSGVADDEAPAVRLEESLRTAQGLDTRVYTYAIGMEATNALVSLVHRARVELRPDLIVVYAPWHHAMVPTGIEERRQRLLWDPVFRLFVAAHLELVWDRLLGAEEPCGRGDESCVMPRNLEAFRGAAGGNRLAVVVDLRDASHFDRAFPVTDQDKAKQQAVDAWHAAHRDVVLLDVSPDEEWAAAGTLADRHWNPQGIRTTMAVLARRLAPLLRPTSN